MNARKLGLIGIVFGIVCVIAGMTFVAFTNSNVAQGNSIMPADNDTHYVIIDCPMCDDSDSADLNTTVKNATPVTRKPVYRYENDDDGSDSDYFGGINANLTKVLVPVKKHNDLDMSWDYNSNFNFTGVHEFRTVTADDVFGVPSTPVMPSEEVIFFPVVSEEPKIQNNTETDDKSEIDSNHVVSNSGPAWMQKALVKASATGICGGEL